ncbi:MAG: acyloxyacyl hydrolase [Deltaproteobacteria bacterium]|nr:acyloxyacyl hydrolase [Deltaproteobacteria bacterium]
MSASFAAALLLGAACHSWAAEGKPVYATIGPFDVLGSGPNYLDAGAGLFNFYNKADKRSIAERIELRFGKKLAFVGPALGVFANGEGFRYGYAGIYADFCYKRFVLTPLFAAGVYHRGGSLDLGGPFEFRESLEIAYRFDDRWQAGVSVAHISNAKIYRNNPGQQDLLLTIAGGF